MRAFEALHEPVVFDEQLDVSGTGTDGTRSGHQRGFRRQGLGDRADENGAENVE